MSRSFILQISWKRCTDPLLFLFFLLYISSSTTTTTTKAFVMPSAIISPMKLGITPLSSILHATNNNNNNNNNPYYTTTNTSTESSTLNRNRQKPTNNIQKKNNNNQSRRSRPKRNYNQRPTKKDLATEWKNSKDHAEAMTDHVFNDLSEPGSIYKNDKVRETFSLLFLWSKYATVAPNQAPIIMDDLIQRLEQEQQYQKEQSIDPEDMIKLNIGIYNSMLYAYTYSAMELNEKQAAQRACEILYMLQEKYEAGNGEAPDSKSFKLVYRAVCEIGAIKFARRLLSWMEFLHKNKKNVNAEPLLIHYNLLLNAYAKSQELNAGLMAEELIQHMHETNIVQPITSSYNIVLKAWAKSSKAEAAKNAERIMNEMAVPKDIVTYGTVISAWANARMKEYGALQAEKLLEQIKQDPNVTPNTVVVSSVMLAWVRSESPKAVDKTFELLQYMEEESKNNPDIAPNLVSYFVYLQSLSLNSKNSFENAQKAHDFLTNWEMMSDNGQISFRPDRSSYNVVFGAWLSQVSTNNNIVDDDDDAEERQLKSEVAARNVHDLLKMSLSGGLQPDSNACGIISKIVTQCTASDAIVELANDLLDCIKTNYDDCTSRMSKNLIASYISNILEWSQRYNIKDLTDRAVILLEY